VQEAVEEWVHSQVDVLDITASRTRPWAEVWRLETTSGRWWLKVNAPGTGYEARLLRHLSGLGTDLLPTTHTHPEQPWALIADAGPSARELLADADPAAVIAFWCALMPRYAELQQSVSATDLLDMQLPDLTPVAVATTFDELVNDRRWFTPDIAPDYSPDVHRRVLSCRTSLTVMAAELAGSIPATVQHDDLHDGNVFAVDGRVRVLDWGDAVVSHPFCSLRVTLDGLAARLGVERTAPALEAVTDAYLEVWATAGTSRRELRAQVDLAVRVAGLSRAASWARALGSPEQGRELGFSEAVAVWMARLADDVLDHTAPAPGGPPAGPLG
jgi:hypothetical protein